MSPTPVTPGPRTHSAGQESPRTLATLVPRGGSIRNPARSSRGAKRSVYGVQGNRATSGRRNRRISHTARRAPSPHPARSSTVGVVGIRHLSRPVQPLILTTK
nr:hypothetical protein GCM10010200_096450 [Actinomadura rugatobispora]